MCENLRQTRPEEKGDNVKFKKHTSIFFKMTPKANEKRKNTALRVVPKLHKIVSYTILDYTKHLTSLNFYYPAILYGIPNTLYH